MLEIDSGTQNQGEETMLLNTTDQDYEILKNELMSLIQKSEDGLAKPSETAISAGLATLKQPLPINRLLIERALKAIYNQSEQESSERQSYCYHMYKDLDEAEQSNRLDRVGQDFFRSLNDQLPW